MLQARENLMEAIQAFLKKYDQIPPKEKSIALLLAEEKFLKIKQARKKRKSTREVYTRNCYSKLINDCKFLNVPITTPTYRIMDLISNGDKRFASILEGFTDEPPLKENDDLFDLESKENEWKKILYDAPIDDLMTEDKVFDPGILEKFFSLTYASLIFEDRHYLSLTYVIRIFLLYLTYSKDSSLFLSSGSEDTIFDPGISIFSTNDWKRSKNGDFRLRFKDVYAFFEVKTKSLIFPEHAIGKSVKL
ncbi:hypothetical protein Tco_0881210 [Tanacetum coccineum]